MTGCWLETLCYISILLRHISMWPTLDPMYYSMSEYVLSFPWYMLCTYWYLWGLVGTYYRVYRSPSLDIIYIIWYHRPLEWSSGGVYHIYGSSNNHLWSDPSEELVSGVILWRSYHIYGSWHTDVRQDTYLHEWHESYVLLYDRVCTTTFVLPSLAYIVYLLVFWGLVVEDCCEVYHLLSFDSIYLYHWYRRSIDLWRSVCHIYGRDYLVFNAIHCYVHGIDTIYLWRRLPYRW
jgi:hypothetical protein